MVNRVHFFANGNTAVFDEHGQQIEELQQPWLLVFVEFLAQHGVDVDQISFHLPGTGRARLFKTTDGKYNWEIKYLMSKPTAPMSQPNLTAQDQDLAWRMRKWVTDVNMVRALDVLEVLLPLALEHTAGCASLKAPQHQPGYTHYETDRGEPCPEYHYRQRPCDCGLPEREAAVRKYVEGK